MPSGPFLRLLLLILPATVGWAVATGPGPAADHPLAVSRAAPLTVSAPRQSLPTPVHDEATCAFCQAAIFPPCVPQPIAVQFGEHGFIHHEQPAPEARLPHVAAARPASSRAPPSLRSA